MIELRIDENGDVEIILNAGQFNEIHGRIFNKVERGYRSKRYDLDSEAGLVHRDLNALNKYIMTIHQHEEVIINLNIKSRIYGQSNEGQETDQISRRLLLGGLNDEVSQETTDGTLDSPQDSL